MPLKKFMIVKQFDINVTLPTITMIVLELITIPNHEYPLVCMSVSNSENDTNSQQKYKLDLFDFNNDLNEPHIEIGSNVVDVVNVTSMDRETVLIAYDNLIHLVHLDGSLCKDKWKIVEFRFDFKIYNVVCLKDSLLVFHKHGVQGRSLKSGEVTQEITDYTKTYRLLGSDK